MEWYFERVGDEILVPRYQELSDRLPSPGSQSKWGISASESFRSPSERFVMDTNMEQQELTSNDRNLCDEVELDTFHDEDQSTGFSSEECFHRRAFSRDWPDCHLNDVAGFDQMTDIFLNSLLEDRPDTENIDESFYLSPDSLCGMMPDDNLESESMWTGSMGNSKYPKGNAFSPLMGWDNQDVASMLSVPCNLEQIDCQPLQGPSGEDLVSSELNGKNRNLSRVTSPEEFVLQELELVMTQLTEKTRIGFRDALFRLANNSKHHNMATRTEDESLATEKPALSTPCDITMRSESKKAMESETNAIDRAVANLMFNEMDCSVGELCSSASEDSNGIVGDSGMLVNCEHKVFRATGPQNYNLSQQKIGHAPPRPILPGDAEVPILLEDTCHEHIYIENSQETLEATLKK